MSTTPDNPDDGKREKETDTRPDPDKADAAVEQLVSEASTKKRGIGPVAAVAAVAAFVAAFFGIRALIGDDSAKDATGPSTEASAKSDSSGAAVGARTPEQIHKSGVVRIGVFSDKAPFGSVNQDGAYEGYDIVYAERIAKDLGVKVEYVPVEAASRVEFLTSGKVDIILANFTVTPERAEKVDFANPYMKVSLGVVSPKDGKVAEESALANKKIIVVKGTTADSYLQAAHPDWDVTKYEQYTEATSALIDGRGDAWITDNTEALAFSLQNEDKFVTSITQLGPVDSIAAAVQKGNAELLSWLNEQIVALGEEKFFHGAYEKTLKPVYGQAAKPEDLVVEGGQLTGNP